MVAETVKKEKNPINELMIWQDVVSKENRTQVLSTNFSLNPVKLQKYSFTEKPTFVSTSKNKIPQNTEIKFISDQEISEQFMASKQVPQIKYKNPVTQNQEIGWLHGQQVIISQQKLIIIYLKIVLQLIMISEISKFLDHINI